jgi:hypothetical protein
MGAELFVKLGRAPMTMLIVLHEDERKKAISDSTDDGAYNGDDADEDGCPIVD